MTNVHSYMFHSSNIQIHSCLPDNSPANQEAFRSKPVVHWDVDDVMFWLVDVASRLGIEIEQLRTENFQDCPGWRLARLSQPQFEKMDPRFGRTLYAELAKLLTGEICWMVFLVNLFCSQQAFLSKTRNPKSENNSDFSCQKVWIILSSSRMKAIFKYLSLNFKSMLFGVCFSIKSSQQRKTHFL